MSSELRPTPLRAVDLADLRKDFAALEARSAVLTEHGQKLLARIRPSSKYYGQSDVGALFAVCIRPGGEYSVAGGPGGQYRLADVDLFAVFEEGRDPIQITFAP